VTGRRGVRLALDWGQARIGVAACDALGTLAYPVETIHQASDHPRVLASLRRLVAEYEPTGIVLGLPRHLGGAEGSAAAGVRERAAWVASQFPGLEVRLVDERLTTVTAARTLREAGRPAKRQRAVIDQAAAVAILDHALELERHSGQAAGELVGTGRTED